MSDILYSKNHNKNIGSSKSRDAFVQSSFRSNYIIIGYSILYSFFGGLIISRMALTVIIIVPYIILTIWGLKEEDEQLLLDNIKSALKKSLQIL